MFKKFGIVLLAGIALSGCDQNVTATIYARDVDDLIASSDDTKTLPVTMEVDIQSPGLRDRCAKPEMNDILKAVSEVFNQASVIGCEQVKGAVYDSMKLKLSSKMRISKDGENFKAENMISFSVIKPTHETMGGVFISFTPDFYKSLNDKLQSINMMAKLDQTEAHMTVNFENDNRENFSWTTAAGNFYDGKPQAAFIDQTLTPRQSTKIKLGDVSMAYLTSQGYYQIGWIPQLAK